MWSGVAFLPLPFIEFNWYASERQNVDGQNAY